MKRLNLSYFIQLGGALEPLTDISFGDFNANIFRNKLIQAHPLLKILTNDPNFPLAIPASRPAVTELLKLVDSLLAKKSELETGDQWKVYSSASKLKTLLSGELAIQSAYYIWPKRAFDTGLLINQATKLFSEEIAAWFTDDEIYNVQQAGKCLAFETPTAAGFHLIRAAEAVIRRYYAQVVGTMPAPKARNWGAYIRNLKAAGADPKVLHALEQIKDLHRNPVIHPEVQLTLEEAISLLGITESIISALYADMKVRETAAAKPKAKPTLKAVGSDDDIPF